MIRPFRRLAVQLGCAALVLASLQLVTHAAGAEPAATPPAPGTLARFLSWGYTENALGEAINGHYTSDPTGGDPAPLIRQRPFTDADQQAGP